MRYFLVVSSHMSMVSVTVNTFFCILEGLDNVFPPKQYGVEDKSANLVLFVSGTKAWTVADFE